MLVFMGRINRRGPCCHRRSLLEETLWYLGERRYHQAESSEITSIMSSTLLREEKARIIDLGLIVRGGEAVAVELFLSNTMAECGLQ